MLTWKECLWKVVVVFAQHSIPLLCPEPQTWPMPAQRLAGPAWSAALPQSSQTP